jgi:hypothetical protein
MHHLHTNYAQWLKAVKERARMARVKVHCRPIKHFYNFMEATNFSTSLVEKYFGEF